jgi:glycosyltransferase involved in cell wall biosynthesis
MNISIIIPTLSFPETVHKLFLAILDQSVSPAEIVIVDSSPEKEILELCNNFSSKLPIKYFKVNNLLPGEARNFGIKASTGDVIAILDSKTIPRKNWLETGCDALQNKQCDVFFGSTCYIAKTSFQKILQACIYGMNPLETTPGSIFLKANIADIGYFIEGTRTADDLEWRDRIKKNKFLSISPSECFLHYENISLNIFQEVKRAFIYQLHTAKLDVQIRTRVVILGIGISLLTLLIPQWNQLVGWEDSEFYIPNITKSFFYFLSLFALITLAFSRNFSRGEKGIWTKVFFAPLFFLLAYFVLQWNERMAFWVESSIYYVPHITKIYLGFLIFSGIAYRGIYIPLQKGISIQYLFPLYWIWVGMVGFIIDLARVPGYLIGALASILRIGKS